MKMPLVILAAVMVLLAAFHLFAPRPGPDVMQARTDLPWQIEVRPDGTSRVFDIDLGRATLGDAIEKFGDVEGLAVFERVDGPGALEAYFGTVHFGPLRAKVITSLGSSEAELRELISRARGREGSPSGDWKYPLQGDLAVHTGRRVTGITYIPATRGLDVEFIRQRFGEPAARLREDEQAVSWLYPDRGLSILIVEGGREVFEYRAPRDFVMPRVDRSPGAVE